ncbi:hypothetical protein L1987_05794 [Smallanthus sonchifolius]|uniref:Uncharacterized protein n=1 Tax=Smallanthus sonchifolius TaxID=185202 RepID=A0ACB9JWG3_9ASTR|nr:hypothetical protein L1987_05794 [Smallanthus sonchifolius]
MISSKRQQFRHSFNSNPKCLSFRHNNISIFSSTYVQRILTINSLFRKSKTQEPNTMTIPIVMEDSDEEGVVELPVPVVMASSSQKKPRPWTDTEEKPLVKAWLRYLCNQELDGTLSLLAIKTSLAIQGLLYMEISAKEGKKKAIVLLSLFVQK